MIKQKNTKSFTLFESSSCIVGSTANEFNIAAFCYERAGFVVVVQVFDNMNILTDLKGPK